MPPKPRTCIICEKPAPRYAKYCPRCRRIIGENAGQLRLRIALQKAWNKEQDGFLCYYTGVKLEEYDTSSPWYITMDHFIPRKNGTEVVCAYVINDMKSNLSGDEFRAVIMEYDRHRKGAPFNRDIVKFQYWTWKAKAEKAPLQSGRPLRVYNVEACEICGGTPDKASRYCIRCRDHYPNVPGRRPAMKASWNKEQDGFLDHYLGVRLEEKNIRSPYYMVFDHRIPRKYADLVATSMLMNRMKTDLSEAEFNLMMDELARHFEGKPFDRDVIGFKYWKRAKYPRN